MADATLPNGFWGMGPHNLDNLISGVAAPTIMELQRAIEDRIESDADTAWDNYLHDHYSR